MNGECHLEVQDSEYAQECDGCGSAIAKGQTYLNNIESCCGGCVRVLCVSCVDFAYGLIALHEERKAKLARDT